MGNSDNLFNGLLGKSVNEGINSTNEKNTSAQVRLFLALAGILFFVGAEAVKIVFRKNFGIKGINMFRLIVCFICFLGLGILGVLQFLFSDNVLLNKEMGVTASSYFVTGAFYIILAFYMLRKGILERANAIKNQVNTDFTGESDLLKVLSERGWSQRKIQYLAEPVYTLLLGVLLAIYNPIAAIPLVFCALSVWAHAVLEFMFIQNPLQPQMNSQSRFPQAQPQQPIKSNRVNTDL